MDRRIAYKIVIDTETCPLNTEVEGVDPFNMWAYDIGWVVTDKRGTVYVARSYVVREIFFGEKNLMQSAYYADKLPLYYEKIAKGETVVASLYEIRKQLLEDVETFEVEEVYAHNMRFDYHNLNNTQRWLTKSKYRFFLPYGVEVCDTLKMSRDVIGKMPTFIRFCEENGFLTKIGKPQMKAEVLYKFITKDLDFIESHMGLEDVMIEKEILAYCYRQHKKMRKALWEN